MEYEQFYDRETGEYVTLPAKGSGSRTSHGSRMGIYTLIYFVFLAALMYPAQKMHMGEGGIFFAMVIAGVILGACCLIVKLVRTKVQALGVTRRGFFQLMVGYTPEMREAEADEDENEGETRALTVPDVAPASVVFDGYAVLPDEIIEDNPLRLAECFQPNVESVLAATLLLCGIRRSGKSNALCVLAEELARYYCPMCIGDTEDEYSGLADHTFLPRGVLAGSLDLLQELRGQQSPLASRFVAIDQDGAYEFGQAIARDVLQVVLNLRSFESDNDAARIMAEIMDGMSDWESSQPNHLRVPCMFFLDEANKWIPQQIAESCVTDREALARLQKAIFGTMVRRGGKRGLGIALCTQRIAELDKRALQSTWKFLFRQTEEVDIDRYAALGLDRDATLELRQGECFIFSPTVIGFPARFRQTRAPHQGHTPGLEQLAKHLQHIRPLDILLASTRFTGGDAAAAGPQTDNVPTVKATKSRLSPELQRALDAYQPGMSYRELGRAIGCGKDKAGELLTELKTRQLIVGEVEEVDQEAEK